MDEYQTRKCMEACFQGTIDRDCGNCHAYYENGGGCCYGVKFDSTDHECMDNCIHRDNCAEDSEPQDLWGRRRPVAPATREPVPSRVLIRPRTSEPISIPQPVRKDVGQVSVIPENNFERFVKDSTWSAGEGFFKGAFEFFRTHRWR